MADDFLTKAIQEAKKAADAAEDYKPQTYLAVLLVALLRKRPATMALPRPETDLHPPSSTSGRAKPYSAPEFFAATSWRTERDKIVLAGSFLERYGGVENFNVSDIRTCLVSAKIPLPKNLPLSILKTVQRGWLMEVPEGKNDMKAYTLTQTGEQRVGELRPNND